MTNSPRIFQLLAIGALGLLMGCGGGGGSAASSPTAIKYSISWAARSRTLPAPSSAKSVTLTLTGASTVGGDFVDMVNRVSDPVAYTALYTSEGVAKRGTFPLTVNFFSGLNGGGSIVATAHASVSLKADGTGIGDIAVDSKVAAVTVAPLQTAAPDETVQLSFSAFDSAGHLLAVSQGSESWSVVDGGEFATLTPDGLLTGVSTGTVHVKVSLDGVSSASAPVDVVLPAAFANPGFEVPDVGTNKWKEDADLVGSSWTGDSHHGIANGDSAWGRGGHSSVQYAYLQARPPTPGTLEQTVGHFVIGKTYRVRFWMSRRNGGFGADVGTPLSLFADSAQIFGPTAPTNDAQWTQWTSTPFVATKASYHFKFIVELNQSQDRATLLDDVEILASSE